MNLLTVAEIAKATRIPAPTARRYASLFKDFLSGEKVGRVTRYPESSLKVFQRISDLYSEGRVTHEIENILSGEVTRTIEVTTSPVAQPPAPVSSGVSEELVTAFTEVMGKLGSCMEIIANQKAMIESQQDDITKLKTAFVMLARNQKKMKAITAQPQLELPSQEILDKYRELEKKDTELEEMALGLSFDTSDIKVKLQILESELVRLRKDRRDMEKFLQDKIDRLRTEEI